MWFAIAEHNFQVVPVTPTIFLPDVSAGSENPHQALGI